MGGDCSLRTSIRKGGPEMGDVGVEGVDRRLGWGLSPDGVDEPVAGEGVSAGGDETGEQRPGFVSRNGDRGLAAPHLEGSEDADVE